METRANERCVYLNGAFLPESRALLSFRDSGFVYGDCVFDTARTFKGKIFRLEQHVDRLFQSLAYTRIEIQMDRQEIMDTWLATVPCWGPMRITGYRSVSPTVS